MDDRLYFIFGDFISNIIVGVIMAVIPSLFVDSGWNMFAAMVVMMAVAMPGSLFLSLLLGIVFGAMEIMIPVMLSGMFGGMLGAMWLAMGDVGVVQLVYLGAITGFVTVCTIWVVNARMRGIRTYGA